MLWGVLPGHWSGLDEPEHDELNETNAHRTRAWKCRGSGEFCEGGMSNKCIHGHRGVLCESCEAGFVRDWSAFGMASACRPR
eukprot:1316703-Prymnesium_polylepis.1